MTDIIFEPFNEPPDLSGTEWYDYMVALHAACRAAASNITLIITPENFADASALVDFTPLVDPKTMYSFHHYHPVIFTFQTQNEWGDITRLKFPPFGPDRNDFISAVPSAEDALETYFDTPQDIQHLSSAFSNIVSWADTHNIEHNRIYLGEFGAWGDFDSTIGADITSREHYYRGIRLEAEANGFSWAAFNLISPGDGFGLSENDELNPILSDALFGEIGVDTINGADVGTLPTGWEVDGSSTATWNVTDVGTEDGIPYFELTITSNSGEKNINMVWPSGYGGVTGIAQGDIMEAYAYINVTSGSLSYAKFSIMEFSDDYGNFYSSDSDEFAGTLSSVTVLRHGFRRHLHEIDLVDAARANAALVLSVTNGTAVVRIGAPQLRVVQ